MKTPKRTEIALERQSSWIAPIRRRRQRQESLDGKVRPESRYMTQTSESKSERERKERDGHRERERGERGEGE